MSNDEPNKRIRVFKNMYLTNAATPGLISQVVSPPMAMFGNTVALVVQVVNFAGSSTPAAAFELQGSYDGRVWDVMDSATASAFEAATVTEAEVAYAFVRVSARITGGLSVRVLFDLDLVFSAQ